MIPRSLMIGASFQPAGGGGENISIAYSANYTNTTSGAPQTFNSVTLPNPETDRLIAVAIHAEAAGGATINSVTVAGNSATINGQIVGDRAIAGIASLVDSSNSTGSIVVTFSGSVLRCTIGVWTVRDYDSVTPSDSDTQSADPSTGLSFSLNIPSGAGAICVQTNGNNSTPMSWNGASEQYDFDSGGVTTQYSGADVQPTESDRPTHSVTTSHSSSGQGSAGVAVVWEKAVAAPEPFVFNDTVSSDQGQYNVATEATNAGWNETDVVEATITVNAKVKGNTGQIGFTTGSLPANSTVDVTVGALGKIWGGGGNGGSGGSGSSDGSAGGSGRAAMNFTVDGSVTINSGGEVGGGSGGGGGGGGGWFKPPSEPCDPTDGGGGGKGWPSGGSDTVGEDGSNGFGSGGTGGKGGDKNHSPDSPGTGGGGGSHTCGANGNGAAGGSQGPGVAKNGNSVPVTNNGTLFGTPAQQP